MRGRARWLLAAPLLIAAGIGTLAWVRGHQPAPRQLRVGPGFLHERIVAHAVVVPAAGIADVRAQVVGQVLTVRVREGERVEAGALLAEIDATELSSELVRRRAEQRALAAVAQTVSEGAREEERSAQQAELAAAQQDLGLALDRHQRLSRLWRSAATSEASVEEARLVVERARARAEALGSRLRLLSGGRRSEIRAARARTEAAGAVTRLTRTELDRTRLRAPIAGVVLARRIDPGDTITAAEVASAAALFEIADPTRLELRAEIEEDDAPRVAVDLAVEVTLPGQRGAVARGRVLRRGGRLEARTIGVNDARVRADGRVLSAWIGLDPGAGAAAWPIGTRLDARVALPPRAVPALLDRAAVVVSDGQAWVDVPLSASWLGGLAGRRIPVQLGAADERALEVTNLPSGQLVLARRPHED